MTNVECERATSNVYSSVCDVIFKRYRTWICLKDPTGCYCLNKLHKYLIMVVQTICLSISYFKHWNYTNYSHGYIASSTTTCTSDLSYFTFQPPFQHHVMDYGFEDLANLYFKSKTFLIVVLNLILLGLLVIDSTYILHIIGSLMGIQDCLSLLTMYFIKMCYICTTT